MSPTDEEILDLVVECGGDCWAVAEYYCDREVAAGQYEGCSTELELHFSDYEAHAERVLAEAGGR